MPITSIKIHLPASLRSDGDRHRPGTGDRDRLGTVIGIKSESVIAFVGINNQRAVSRKTATSEVQNQPSSPPTLLRSPVYITGSVDGR